VHDTVERGPFVSSVVVLDWMLPTMSGSMIQQEIAANRIPLVIITGSPDTIEAPCVLRQPVSPAQLVKAVRLCLASHRQS
jgi:DNA-binding response OmpR family regulator